MANLKKIDKAFVSEIDKRFAEFDRTHKKSASQQAEIKKYERIYRLRDNPTVEDEAQDLFE